MNEMKFHSLNLPDLFCIYAKEIYTVFSQHPKNTTFQEANIVLTCLSDELNYPKYKNMDYARGKQDVGNLEAFIQCIQKKCKKKKTFITFYHTTPTFSFQHRNVINVCYSKSRDDTKSILICPPAIKTFSFHKQPNKKYLISFKGNIHASPRRNLIFDRFSKYTNDRNIFNNNSHYDYDDLMTNSEYGVVIEGDLPWSYRLTECINAGAIPVIVKPETHSVCAFEELVDYKTFAFVIRMDEIDTFMTNTLPNIQREQYISMLQKLEQVNAKYFVNREAQMQGVLDILQRRRLT